MVALTGAQMAGMKRRRVLSSSVLLGVLLAAACTPAGPTGGAANQAGPSEPAKPKRITVSVMDEPTSLRRQLNAPSVRGIDVVEAGGERFPMGEWRPPGRCARARAGTTARR